MCEKNCLNCQFLVFNCPDGSSDLVGQDLREMLRANRDRLKGNIGSESSGYSLGCYKKCWDSAYLSFDSDSVRLQIEEKRNAKNSRGNSCFYFEFQEGMQLEAANELEKRETLQKETAADRRWIKWGVWATFCVVLATFYQALAAKINPIIVYFWKWFLLLVNNR